MLMEGSIVNVDVCAGIIEQNGLYLIARRRPGGAAGGLWEFPGGKVENGETPEACLVRELLEELGVEVTVGRRIGVSIYNYGDKDIKLIGLEAKILKGRPQPHDHAEIRWVAPRELGSYEFAQADEPFVRILATSRDRSR